MRDHEQFYILLNNHTLEDIKNLTLAGAEIYSPVTLAQAYPRLTRLLCMFATCFPAILMSGFFVSAFFIEPNLRNTGNVFMAIAGLSDFLVTGVIFPVVTAVILSDDWDTEMLCKVLQIVAGWSTYSYSLCFMMMGFETFLRTLASPRPYMTFLKMKLGLIGAFIFIFSGVLSAVGVYYQMDYDYCSRAYHGDLVFRMTTMASAHVLPGILACIFLFLSISRIQKRYNNQPSYQTSQQYVYDSITTNLNIFAYVIYVAFWAPYVVVVFLYPDSANSRYYTCAWFGLGRSIITSGIYGLVSENFRHAYGVLFNYCCCKSSISDKYEMGHRSQYRCRDDIESGLGGGELRVHFLHHLASSRSQVEWSVPSDRNTHEL